MIATEHAAGDPGAASSRTEAARERTDGDDGIDPFAEFYRGHLGKVHRALALTLGNDDLAREAADEAMTRAYAHWRKVRDLDNPAGWVYRVGLNWATSWWRKTRWERNRLHDGLPRPVEAADPTALAARVAVERLPLKQRSVVVCRVLLDFSTVETATALGISEGTVKSRLSRALTTLRQAMEE